MFIRRPSLLFAGASSGSRSALGAPADFLGAALVAWWNADDHGTANMTVETGERVVSWIDRIGGLDVTAPTAVSSTARPTWSATAFVASGGTTKAGVAFDGTANCLTGATTGLPVSSTAGELWGVATGPATADSTVRFVAAYGGTGGGTFRRIAKTAAGQGTASDGTITATVASGTWIANPRLISGQFDATTVTARVNGVPGVAVAGATLNTGTTRLRIGASTANTPASFWLGAVRHIFITTVLTEVQRQLLDAWSAWDSEMVGTT